MKIFKSAVSSTSTWELGRKNFARVSSDIPSVHVCTSHLGLLLKADPDFAGLGWVLGTLCCNKHLRVAAAATATTATIPLSGICQGLPLFFVFYLDGPCYRGTK